MESSPLTILAVASAPIQYAEAPSVPWVRIILSLLFCVALAIAAIVFIRRRSADGGLGQFTPFLARTNREQRQLELMERLPLTGTSHICLVRCGDNRFVILVSAAGAQLVEKLDPHDVQGPSA